MESRRASRRGSGYCRSSRAATWYHLEVANRPFSTFEDTADGGDGDSFVARFVTAFVRPGCSTSGYVQSADAPVEEYVFEEASMAQAAGIEFEEAIDHIVQGLHQVFTPVKLAISHHPSATPVALVADISRAARMIGLDPERPPGELWEASRPGEPPRFNRSRERYPILQSPSGGFARGLASDPRPPLPVGASESRPSAGENRHPSTLPPTRAGGVVERALPARRDRESPAMPTRECWRCGRTGHYIRDCPEGNAYRERRGENYTTSASGSPSVDKYLKECVVNGEFRIQGLMDTGCSAVLVRASRINDMNIRVILESTPIYGTGDVSTPATHTLGRVVFGSLQVDEGVASDIEALVVPDHAIPEDLCVGRTFLHLPHMTLLRMDAEFFVGPPKSTLEKIRRADTVRPCVTSDVEIRPGMAAMVEAKTRPVSAIVVRAPDRDFVYHSDADGMIQLPIENRSAGNMILRAGEFLAKCRVLPEEEFGAVEQTTGSSAGDPGAPAGGIESYRGDIGCRRPISM